MTCIVGIAEKGKVYIGADSAGVDWMYGLQTRADQKAFENGPFVMGFTSSFRMGQLLRWAFRPPDHDPREAVEKFMVLRFVDEVRRCLKEGGWAQKDKETESGGTFLVGYKGRLFEIRDDYQVGERTDGFAAVGCGEAYALGVLYATKGIEPRVRLEHALQAAAHFSAGVRGPFTFVEGGAA